MNLRFQKSRYLYWIFTGLKVNISPYDQFRKHLKFPFTCRIVDLTSDGFILSVFFDDHEEVKGGGGIFLQALPGADIEVVGEAEKMMLEIGSLGELFAKGQTPEEIIQETFLTLKPKVLDSRAGSSFSAGAQKTACSDI